MTWTPYFAPMRRVRDRLLRGPALTAELAEIAGMPSGEVSSRLHTAKSRGHVASKPVRRDVGPDGGRPDTIEWKINNSG